MITKLQAAYILAAVSWMVGQSGAATVGAAGVRTAGVDAGRPPMVVRAGHTLETWPAEEQVRVTVRMVAFARAAVLGQSSVPGGRMWSNIKELAATASDVWEPSSHPDYMQ
jgi:hypothetical protein